MISWHAVRTFRRWHPSFAATWMRVYRDGVWSCGFPARTGGRDRARQHRKKQGGRLPDHQRSDEIGAGWHVAGSARLHHVNQTCVNLVLPKCLLTWDMSKSMRRRFVYSTRTGTARAPSRWRFDLLSTSLRNEPGEPFRLHPKRVSDLRTSPQVRDGFMERADVSFGFIVGDTPQGHPFQPRRPP